MMPSKLRFRGAVVLACGLACGTAGETIDGGLDASDALMPDDAVSDETSAPPLDAGTEAAAEAGQKYPPARWSVAFEHAGFADGDWHGGTVGVGIQASAGFQTAQTAPLVSDAVATVLFDDSDGGLKKSVGYSGDTIVEVGPVVDTQISGEQLTMVGTPGGVQTPLYVWDLDTNPPYWQVWTANVNNPAPRIHQDPISSIIAIDSLSTGAFGYNGGSLQPGGMMVINRSPAGWRVFQGASATTTIAVDSVRGNGSQFYLAGRTDGTAFAFGDAGTVTGSGFFVAQFVPLYTAVQWIRVFGGVPLHAVSEGTSAAEATSVRISADHKMVGAAPIVITAPFTGTIDFGGGKQFSAPAGAQATVLAVIDASGNVTMAKAFAKGSASAGKPSRPSAYAVHNSVDALTGYRLFDTVWDTIDLGGTVVTATSGADVVVADFDPTGALVSTRLYGGAGDDEAFRIIEEPFQDDYVIVGHSAQAIDFGNGVLSTSAPEGETWIARLPP